MKRDVEVRPTADRGLGVFAKREFAPGELVFRRTHRVVGSRAEVAALPEDVRSHVCQVDVDEFARVEPPGCFLNHSCEPSAVRHGVAVLALRAIEAGDEVTLDYRLNALDGGAWACRCGTASCSGTVEGSFFALSPPLQERMLEHAPAFIRREHRRRALG